MYAPALIQRHAQCRSDPLSMAPGVCPAGPGDGPRIPGGRKGPGRPQDVGPGGGPRIPGSRKVPGRPQDAGLGVGPRIPGGRKMPISGCFVSKTRGRPVASGRRPCTQPPPALHPAIASNGLVASGGPETWAANDAPVGLLRSQTVFDLLDVYDQLHHVRLPSLVSYPSTTLHSCLIALSLSLTPLSFSLNSLHTHTHT